MNAKEAAAIHRVIADANRLMADMRATKKPELLANCERIDVMRMKLINIAGIPPAKETPKEKVELGPQWHSRPRSGFFTETHDKWLIESEGVYRNLESLAVELGCTVTAAQRRFVAIKGFASVRS